MFGTETLDTLPSDADAKGAASIRQSVISWACGTGRVARGKRKRGRAAAVKRGAQKVGLASTQEPAAGDIAVLRTFAADGAQEVAAIRTAIGWAVLTPTGVAVGSWPVIAAWRV